MLYGKGQFYFIQHSVMRKSKATKDELIKTAERLREIEELNRIAEEEDAVRLNLISDQISKIADDNDMFCGVMLTRQDIIAIIDLSMRTKEEAVKIPFRVYFKD